MNEVRNSSQRVDLRRRAVTLFLLWSAAAFAVEAVTPCAFALTQAGEKAFSRTLTFRERVAYQYAIEEVHWRHRIWPKDNSGPKPPLDAIVSQREIEKRVEDYLCKSQLVADQRGLPISASELQAEMERMATHTRNPDVLGELFEALGNNPLVIAECVAKPILAERLVSELSVCRNGRDGSPSGLLSSADQAARAATPAYQVTYKLPEISIPAECADDTWNATTTVDAPEARETRTAVWTGSE